jgi:acyl carrier protein
MEEDELYARIRDLLIKEFEVPPEAISREARTREDLELDSLDHVDLVVELERFAGRRIESDELTNLKTVGDAVDLLRAQLEAAAAERAAASGGNQGQTQPSDAASSVPQPGVDAD